MGRGGARKGLSFEEKRTRMLEYMQNEATVFQLKELEKLLPKATGIISQSVKEVLQSLCDDALCETDKIGFSAVFSVNVEAIFCKYTGSGNFFWTLPSKQVGVVRFAALVTCKLLSSSVAFCFFTETLKTGQAPRGFAVPRLETNRFPYPVAWVFALICVCF